MNIKTLEIDYKSMCAEEKQAAITKYSNYTTADPEQMNAIYKAFEFSWPKSMKSFIDPEFAREVRVKLVKNIMHPWMVEFTVTFD